MLRLYFFVLAVTLQACTTIVHPTAESSKDFPIVSLAKVSNTDVFSDCMLSTLNSMKRYAVNYRTIQQEVRIDRTIIDTAIANGDIQVSRTEIFDDGNVQIRTLNYVKIYRLDLSYELKAFKACVDKSLYRNSLV